MSELFKNHYYLIEEKRLIFNQLSRLLVRVCTSSIWINILFEWNFMASKQRRRVACFCKSFNLIEFESKTYFTKRIPRVYYIGNVFRVSFRFDIFYFFFHFSLAEIHFIEEIVFSSIRNQIASRKVGAFGYCSFPNIYYSIKTNEHVH